MKTELILVGKTNDKLYINGIKDYTERISHYMPFNITTIPALKNTKNLSEDQQKQAEGEQILRLIQPSDTVVLLDELEKAHPDVFNLLLQVMDEGHITDSLGRKVDFKNTIIIMTSNIGTRQLKDFGRGVGFDTGTVSEKDVSRSVIQKSLNKAFSPEFLNRIDDIITFDQLDKESIFKIIDIELKGFFDRISALGYRVELTDEAKNFVAEKGYDIQFGARPLKRAIQNYLEDEVAEIILRTENKKGGTIRLDYDSVQKKIIASLQEE